MKKFFISLFFCAFIFASSSNAIEVRVNYGKFNLPEDPIIVNDRVLVPLKVIAEIFDAEVQWNPAGVVTIRNNEDVIIFPIDSKIAIVNEKIVNMDSPAVIKNSTTMVPLKFLSDFIDAKIEWEEETAIANIVIENEAIIAKAEAVSRSYANRGKYVNALNKIVVIDAGHGGKEVGATYSGVYEKDLNLKIAQHAKAELEKNGVRVYMTRNSDSTTSLSYRTTLANNMKADLFVSVHNNAMTSKSEINGTEVLYPTSNIVKNGITSYSLANNLQGTVSSIAGTYNKGIINRNNLYVLNHTKMPAVIVEVAYMTNYSDMQKLKNEDFLIKAGQAIAQGILESF